MNPIFDQLPLTEVLSISNPELLVSDDVDQINVTSLPLITETNEANSTGDGWSFPANTKSQKIFRPLTVRMFPALVVF